MTPTRAQTAERIMLEDAMATADLSQIAEAMAKRDDGQEALTWFSAYLNSLADARRGHPVDVLRTMEGQ